MILEIPFEFALCARSLTDFPWHENHWISIISCALNHVMLLLSSASLAQRNFIKSSTWSWLIRTRMLNEHSRRHRKCEMTRVSLPRKKVKDSELLFVHCFFEASQKLKWSRISVEFYKRGRLHKISKYGNQKAGALTQLIEQPINNQPQKNDI